jgi:hypothetical protein
MSRATTDAQKTTERYGFGRGRIESKNKNNSTIERARLNDQCRGCERELPSPIARVCGDNDGCVPVCDECASTVIETRRNTVAIALRARREADR